MKKAVVNGFLKLNDLLVNSHTAFILFIEISMGIISSISLGVLFVYLSTEIFETNTQTLDILFSNFVYLFRHPLLTSLMLFITDLGADYILIALVAITIFLVWRKHRLYALLFLIIFLMGVFINASLKLLIQRPRPLISPLISVDSYSFPSGHAMNSLVFYATISFYLYHFTRRRLLSIAVSVFCVLIVFLIGLSRIYLGVHYLSDVIAGYLVGFWWFVTALAIQKTIVFLKLFRNYKA